MLLYVVQLQRGGSDDKPKVRVSEKPWVRERGGTDHPTGLQRGLDCSLFRKKFCADYTGFHFITNALNPTETL